jgi:hypothetical protein
MSCSSQVTTLVPQVSEIVLQPVTVEEVDGVQFCERIVLVFTKQEGCFELILRSEGSRKNLTFRKKPKVDRRKRNIFEG